MNIKMLKAVAVSFALSVSGFAKAGLIIETVDAGETIEDAFSIAGGTTSINGTISNDVDLFKFSLSSDTIFTISAVSSAFDMNLIVFNSLGQGIAGNDDLNRNGGCNLGNGGLDSCLTLSLFAGEYFFAIGINNVGAMDSQGNTIIHNDSGVLPSASTTSLASFYNGFGSGTYTVNFSIPTSSTTSVPEPFSFAILALGIMGLASRRFKK